MRSVPLGLPLGLLCVSSLACTAEPPEILLEVDADPALIPILDNLRIDVDDGGGRTDGLDVPLRGVLPSCLPFSLSVVAQSAQLGDPMTVSVTAEPEGGAAIHVVVDFLLQDGVRLLDVRLPGRCSDAAEDCRLMESRTTLEAIDRDDAARRIAASMCRAPVTPAECVAGGGCYPTEGSEVCETPCPAPSTVVPPETPATVAPAGPPTVTTWRTDPFLACPAGFAHFPREAGCVAIGAECPAGDYATALPAGSRTYVDPDATAGGDGSEGAPDRRLSAALARGTDVVVLSKGTHPSPGVVIDRPVAIVGACAESTRLDASLDVSATGVFLAGFDADGLDVSGAATVSGVALSGSVSVAGGRLDALEVAVRGGDLVVTLDGTVTATRVVVDGADDAALVAMDSARVDLLDLSLLRSGAGVHLGGSATASIATTIVETVRGLGVEVTDEARLGLRASMIRDGASGGVRGAGRSIVLDDVTTTDVQDVGVVAASPATVVLTNVVTRGLSTAAETTLRADTLLIRGSPATFDGLAEVNDLTIEAVGDVGLTVRGRATVVRVHGDRQGDAAILVTEAGDATLDDVDIQGGATTSGVGIEVEPGAVLRVRRARIVDTRSAGVRVQTNTATAATVRIEDLTVEDVRPGRGNDGFGLVVGRADINIDDHLAATLTMTRAQLLRNVGAGIGLSRSVSNLYDVVVRDTTPRVLTVGDFGGYGIVVTNGATMFADRVELLSNSDAGVYAGIIGGATELECVATLTNVRIEGTTCDADESGCQYFRGSGAGVSQAGRVSLRRFLLKGNQYSGVFQFFVGEVDLYDGTIADHPIGADVAGVFDTSRLIRRVRFENNEQAIFSIGE